MLVAIDVGNSNITLGVFSGAALVHTFRLQSRREQTADEYAIALAQLMGLAGVARADVKRAIIGSVVPRLTPLLVRAISRAWQCEALVVTAGTDAGVTLAVDRPAEVGVDRIINVAALREQALADAGLDGADARADVGVGAIAVDLGTATTLDALSPRGELLGGVIVPGMRVSFEALVARAPRLPDVELTAPPRVLGKTTVECLQSGIVYGYASLIDGLVSKLKAELPFECRVVATGGLAAALAAHATSLQTIDPDLTLRGLYFIDRRAQRVR
jgi:type III pantothenate kinase